MLVTASVRFGQSTDQMEGEQRALETGNSVPPAPEGEGAKQAKALDSITDHVEERQLDAERTREAMAALSGRTRDADREKEERERELAKVRIADEDVKIIANEFEVRYSADAPLSHALSSDGGPRSLPSCREEVSLQERSDARACGPHHIVCPMCSTVRLQRSRSTRKQRRCSCVSTRAAARQPSRLSWSRSEETRAFPTLSPVYKERRPLPHR